MKKKERILMIATGVSAGWLVTVVAMRFTVSPKVASIMGGAVAAAFAAVAMTRGVQK